MGRSGKWLNVFFLVCGLACGQGSLFAAQTFLFAKDRLDLVGTAGGHVSFAVLGLFVVESGSTALLARSTRTILTRGPDVGFVWAAYWSVTSFRLWIALLLGFVAIVAWRVQGTTFSTSFALCSIPAFCVWAISPAGILDGIGKSGLSGLAAAWIYVFVAGALALSIELETLASAVLLGSALSFGALVAVASQFAVLVPALGFPRFIKPARKDLVLAVNEGGLMLVNTIPGQLLFRFQILAASLLLGPVATGAFVYIKQITNGITQAVSFIRRAEYIHLLDELHRQATSFPSVIWRASRSGYLVSLAVGIVFVAVGALVFLVDTSWKSIGVLLLMYAPVIIANALYLSLVQGFVAVRGHSHIFAATQLVLWVGVIGSWWVPQAIGLPAFPLAELCGYVFGIIALTTFARSSSLQNAFRSVKAEAGVGPS